jgi:hypothetical protein
MTRSATETQHHGKFYVLFYIEKKSLRLSFLNDRFSVIGMYQSYSSFQGLRYGRESI